MGNGIMEQWHGLAYEDQLAIVKAGIRTKAARYYGMNVLNEHGREMQDFINETFARVLDPARLAKVERDRERNGQAPATLKAYVYTMAGSAINYLVNQDRRHDNRSAGEIDPETQSIADTADSVIARVDLLCFIGGRDERDKAIIKLIIEGYTERQIGAALHISGPAVHKRIVRMRDALTAAAA